MRALTSIILLASFLPVNAQAAGTAFDTAVANIMAANVAADTCSGVQKIGNGSIQDYVIRASDIAAGKGVRKQKLRRVIFYGNADQMQVLGEKTLSDRGVPVTNKGKLCKFASGIAGTDDPLGRFLRK